MGDPRAVEPVARLALLVLAHPGQRVRRDLGLAPVGDEGRHPADGVSAAAVAGGDEEASVSAHERNGHGDLPSVRQHERRQLTEALDEAEDVVPAAGVQARGVVAQLEQDLVHLEGRQDRLDEHGRPDAAAGDAGGGLGVDEDVVPEAGLEVALQLRQVEVRAGPAAQRLGGVVEEVEAGIEQAGRDRPAVHQQVALLEVPAARPHEEGRRPLVQAVGLLGSLEGERAADRVLHGELAADDVRPGRAEGVLEVGHEDAGARVEGVDHHLRLGRPGDLDPPVVEVGRRRRHAPGRGADVRRLGQEARHRACGDLRVARRAAPRGAPPARRGSAARGRPRRRAPPGVRTRSSPATAGPLISTPGTVPLMRLPGGRWPR